MPMSLIDELFRYWREYPPTHWLLRQQTGFEPPKKREHIGPGKPVFFNALPKGIAAASKLDREIFETLKTPQRAQGGRP